MTRRLCTLCLLVSTSTLVGQQFLWSTVETDNFKQISLDKVGDEVLELYDLYDYYLDGAGYNKEGLFEIMEKFVGESEDWKPFKNRIARIEELTIFAIRANLGQGSVVMVFMVNESNVNMIGFSNYSELGSISTQPYKRDKFMRWFNSLLE